MTYVNISVITGTGKDLLIELVYRSYGVVVDVFKVEDWLRLSGVPDADAPIKRT